MHPPVNSGWQARLTGEDPSGFRQSMADLQFHGVNPDWFRQELLDGMYQSAVDEKCESLGQAKSELARQLAKV